MNFGVRIAKDTKALLRGEVPGVSASPASDDDSMHYFNVVMAGPPDTCYKGGEFKLELFLPDGYPMNPPKIRFLTPIWHPNIDRLGRICLDVLKDKWTPAQQVRTVLLSIQALLSTPNPDDPLNNTAAKQWLDSPEDALQKARDWTAKYAK